MELKEVIIYLERSLKLLEDFILVNKKGEVLDKFAEELRRRYFVREFAKLGELLIYFRADYGQKLSEKQKEDFEEQLKITAPISYLKDVNQEFLVQGFTSRRNKLLHKYPFKFWEGNNEMYIDAQAYFNVNDEILKKEIKEIKLQIENGKIDETYELEKVSFESSLKLETSQEQTDLDIFVWKYQLPIEVAVCEINQLFAILNHFNIDIRMLSQHEGRILPLIDPKGEDYRKQVDALQEKLMEYIEKEPYFGSAFFNFMENISVLLMENSYGYKRLEKTKDKPIRTLLSSMDKIFDELLIDEEESVSYYNDAAHKRVSLAHTYEEGFALKNIIPELVALYRLNLLFLKPCLEIISDKGYKMHLTRKADTVILQRWRFQQLLSRAQINPINSTTVRVIFNN